MKKFESFELETLGLNSGLDLDFQEGDYQDTLLKIDSHDKDRLLLNHSYGFSLVDIHDIIRLEGKVNYTKILAVNNKHYTISKGLKEFEKILEHHNFCRVHKSHIINLNFIQEFSSQDFSISLADGFKVPLSRRRLKYFNEIIKHYSIHF